MDDVFLPSLNLLLEWSNNDPIPEVTQNKNGLAVFLAGSSYAGKSTFVHSWLFPRMGQAKQFDVDEVNHALQTKLQGTMTPDDNMYHKGSSGLNRKRVASFLSQQSSKKENFVFELTGSNWKGFDEVFQASTEAGYMPLFLHLITPYKTVMERRKKRSRVVAEDFIRESFHNMKKQIQLYSVMNPNHYYIIVDVHDVFHFYKVIMGKLQFISEQPAP